MCWCAYLWGFCLFVLKFVHLASWICRFVKFGKFLAITISFFPPSRTLIVQILDLLLLSHWSLRLCSIFFPMHFLYVAQIRGILLICPQVTYSSLCHLHLLIQWMFKICYCYFWFCNFHLVFLIILFLCWGFLFFRLFQEIL